VGGNYPAEGIMSIRTAALGSVLAIAIAAGPAFAQKSEPGATKAKERKEIRVVGCVQWEKDYRQARNEGRGGVLGPGIGAGDEFVLIFAQVVHPSCLGVGSWSLGVR
jgi:hypothetical protein